MLVLLQLLSCPACFCLLESRTVHGCGPWHSCLCWLRIHDVLFSDDGRSVCRVAALSLFCAAPADAAVNNGDAGYELPMGIPDTDEAMAALLTHRIPAAENRVPCICYRCIDHLQWSLRGASCGRSHAVLRRRLNLHFQLNSTTSITISETVRRTIRSTGGRGLPCGEAAPVA